MPGAILSMAFVVSLAACRKPPATEQKNPSGQASPPAAAASSATVPGTSPTGPPAPAVEAPKPMPAQLPAVIARVNGENVTKADFDRLIKNMELGAGQPIPSERRDEIMRRSLDQLITYTLLTQETKARKIAVTGAEVEARLGEMRKQFPDEAAFKKALSERGMTVERLREDARIDMVISKMMDAEVANLPPPTDDQARDFYQKNPDKFQQPEAVRASHILIPTGGADEAGKKKLRAQAESLLKQIKDGADFAQLARQHSKDNSAAQGGDLNYFTKGQMVPQFDQVAWALKPGEVSGIVETQFGYHIIKATDRRAASTVEFEKVSERIRQFLMEQQKQQRAEAFVDGLKKKARIEVLV
jgi:peptidyl-prolyl cis-trans isomerase C